MDGAVGLKGGDPTLVDPGSRQPGRSKGGDQAMLPDGPMQGFEGFWRGFDLDRLDGEKD